MEKHKTGNKTKISDRRRFFEIMEVLSKYGLSYIFSRFRIRKHPKDRGVRVRKALEELGTTFIKLGQMLSTRYDLLPVDIILELTKLQDDVPPISFVEYQQVLQQAYSSVQEVFLYIEPNPLGAASIAQVHRALLLDGSEVVVKVRRPGIPEQVDRDIQVLKGIASFAQHFPLFRDFDLQGIVEDFGMGVRREMNFLHEAKALERFNRAFRLNDTVFAPVPVMEHCREDVLVMQYIPGIKFSELIAKSAKELPFQVDVPKMVEQGADAMFQQSFVLGFLHGDPHPGNLIATRDGKLFFIDFGQVNLIDKHTRHFLMEMVFAITRRDAELMTQILIEHFPMKNEDFFCTDVKGLFSEYYGKPLSEFNMSEMVLEVFKLIRKYHIQVPSQLLLMGKIILMIESIARRLDPGFNAIAFTENYLQKRWPSLFADRLQELKEMALWKFLMLPRRWNDLEKFFESGKLKMDIQASRVERLLYGLRLSVNSLAVSIIIAALLISINNFKNQTIAYLAVVLLGVFLVYEILFGERRG
ncbi:MAG TPA: AarF/UbiB family protein [Thermotogota bacterium]|nr:AarF/UbiB family protein [Thermotogota bacterium]HRW91679.1 AarF/UbiB family protein [Thermotogota bacterium]